MKNGYLAIVLHKGGDTKTKYVHRLVLESFTGPAPEGMECLHIDGDKTNNHLDNLRWGTRQENILDIVRHGRHHNANKTHCKHGHAFIPENVPEWAKEKDIRNCLACNRARSYLWKHPELADQFQRIADQYYIKATEGAN